MKSKLSAVLVATVCVLAVSPVNALSVTYNPGATTSSVPGALLFADFDSVQDMAIGSITGGDLNTGTAPATGNWIAANPSTNVTVTFTNPVAYVGFAWGTHSMYTMVLRFSAHSLAIQV